MKIQTNAQPIIADAEAVFLDSWGGVWEICSPDHPEAEAFGPVGTARRLKTFVHHILSPCSLETDEQGWTWVNFNQPEFEENEVSLERAADRSFEFDY